MTNGTYLAERVPVGNSFGITLNGTAGSLSSVPSDATRALISFSVASRIRLDGVAPTASVGFPLGVEKLDVFGKRAIDNLRFIATGTAGTLDVIYFKAQ